MRRLLIRPDQQQNIATKRQLDQAILNALNASTPDHPLYSVISRTSRYCNDLERLNFRDKDLQLFKLRRRDHFLWTIRYTMHILLLTLIASPGLFMCCPIFITSAMVAKAQTQLALCRSPFKLYGKDVTATWKMLTALALSFPTFIIYATILRTTLLRCDFEALSGHALQRTSFFCVLIGVEAVASLACLRSIPRILELSASLHALMTFQSRQYARTIRTLSKRRECLAADLKHCLVLQKVADISNL